MLVDYWANRYCDNPKLRDEVFNPDFEDDVAAFEAELMAKRGAEVPADDWETVSDETYEGKL